MGDWLACPRWCTGPPPHLGWGMGLYHGDVEAVCCHAEIDWYESFPPRARWSFLHGPVFRGGRCWCVRGAHSERKPVRREFGLVLGHGHVHMNGRACSYVCAGAVRMYSIRTGPGHGLRTPYRAGVPPELILELVCYISQAYVPYGVRLG